MEIKIVKHKTNQCLKISAYRYKKLFKGFTLIEIMIVVVLVTVIAGFGLPTYDRIMRKSHERNAILGLTIINKANEIYEVRGGDFYIGGPIGLAAINTNLSIDVKALNLTYSYTGAAAAYTAMAAWTGGGAPFTVEVDEGAIILRTNPYCSVGPCPSLP